MPTIQLGKIPPWEPSRGQSFLRHTAQTNPVGYSKGFMMRSYEDSDLWFPSFKSCYNPGANLAEVRSRGLPTFLGLDVAGDSRPGWALTVLGFDSATQHRYLLDWRHWQGSVITAIQHVTDAVNQAGNLQYVMIENNGVQQMLVDWLTEGNNRPWWWHKIEPFTTGKNKADERYGLRTLEVEFHHKAWVVPSNEFGSHPTTCQCSWCEGVRQVTLYPKGAATDMVMSCVKPGARVTTTRGLIAIEDVQKGDLVLTHRGRWRRVTGTVTRAYNGPATILRAGNLAVTLTADHRVWSACAWFDRAGGCNRLTPLEKTWDWRPASEIRTGRKVEGHYLWIPDAQYPESLPVIDLAQYVKTGPGSWEAGASTLQRRGKVVPRWLHVDRDFGFLLGLYLAEGCLRGAHGNKHQVAFAFHAREDYLVSFVQDQIGRAFNARGVVRRQGNGQTVVFSSVVAARFFKALGNRAEKGLPVEWLGWPHEVLLRVCRGWFLGDGHLIGRRSKALAGVSISRHILHMVTHVLRRGGIATILEPFPQAGGGWGDRPPSKCRPAWKIRIDSQGLRDLLHDPHPMEQERWGSPTPASRPHSNNRLHRQEGGFSAKAAQSDSTQYEGPVYNLHVEEDESYVVEGFAVHNCWFARDAIARWGGAVGVDLGESLAGLKLR